MQIKVTPKDFFLWTGAMVAIYGSVISFIMLVFQYIDYVYPDDLSYVDPYSGSIRFAMSSLIVLVPVALALMRYIRSDIARVHEKSELWVRRWALVLTVFIAGAAVVGDLISLINSFLGGDLTTPFVLKVVALFLVAGGAFFHFLADLRGYWTVNRVKAEMAGYAAGAVVFTTIAAGFYILGSPATIRLLRYDSEKISDLQNIQWQIVNYWQQKEKLPASLSELEDPISGWLTPVDAQSGAPYMYEKIGEMSFKLCGVFNAESRDDTLRSNFAYPFGEFGLAIENWKHGAGEACFDRTIDPERYPQYKNQLR